MSGALIGLFVPSGSGGLSNAHGIVFGLDGRLYVADTPNNRILRYDGVTGAFLDVFVMPSGGLVAPVNLAFGSVGR